MNRFLADLRLAGMAGGALRCACGVLGNTAVAGAISIGTAAVPADAAPREEPEPHWRMPAACRHATEFGDWYTAKMCREAWMAMYRRSWEGTREHPPEPQRRAGRTQRAPKTQHRPPPPKPRHVQRSRPAAPPPSKSRVTPDASPSAQAGGSASAEPAPVRRQADDQKTRARSLQPLLLLGLLLPAAAAIGYPFRRRICAVAGSALLPPPAPPTSEPGNIPFTYRPSIDPFAAPAMGLTGPGAAGSARVLALAALDEHGASSLVVIPRPDAIALFGLAEDDLLDETAAGLFIPGNLDAALAYLETELAIRRNTGSTEGRRLLLVANCQKETDRVSRLLTAHPGGMSAILLGPWPGEQATIDEEGSVTASSGPTGRLPERLPEMSRNEARDRLYIALDRHRRMERPSGRRSSLRRS